MDDYSFIIPDIELEYKKYHDNLKKKYSKIKEASEAAIKEIDSLKLILPKKDDENAITNFKTELNKSMGALLKPIYSVIESKSTKLYLNSLNLLKKFIIYNLINNSEFNNIINYLREIFSINNEESQLKVLEILQYIINGNVVKLTNININSIMDICKIDKIKGHTKYAECKNAIKLILSILAKKIFDITEDKNVVIFIQSLVNSIDGNQKEWISMNTQNSLTKGIRFELICSILETYPEKFKEGEPNQYMEEHLFKFIQKIFQINNDQLIGIKLCRLVMIITIIINKSHLLLEEILKYLNTNNQIKWQKTLGLEVLSQLLKKPEILFEIYSNNINLYENIIKTFTNVTYNTIIIKSQKNSDRKTNRPPSSKNISTSNKKLSEQILPLIAIPNKKYILNNNIFISENDQILNISTSIEYIFKLLIDCYVNLKNSYIFLMEKNGIKINISSNESKDSNEKKDKILNDVQEKIKNMINYNFVDFKGGAIGLLLHMKEVSSVQSFINLFQSFIYIYTSFGLSSSRDELLNDLCKLALPNNLENILEIKEKNILIIRTIFNLSHCTNLLEKNSWLIFIQTVQNLYFILIKSGYYLYNDKQQFNIEVIMKNIESNIKKYSAESTVVEVQKVVQEDEVNKNINTSAAVTLKKGKGANQSQNLRILTSEEKENIDIISNSVNNLFTDTNDYEDKTLIDILNALYEDIEKIIIFYNKQLKIFYNNSLKTENKRKNSEGEVLNKIDDINQNKKNVGKLTVRNEMFKSVLGTTVGGKSEVGNFNINFQNEKILINLSNINFDLVKILGIAIININRINLIWDKILGIIKIFAFDLNEENNFSNNILKFTIDLLGYIIINILLKFKELEEGEEKSLFSKKNLQSTLFIPFINLLNGYYNNFIINPSYMINPFKNIVEKSGTKLNVDGWNRLFEGINLILENKKNNISPQEKEILFKIIEQIFNEYSNYLSIFNVEILLDVLEKFSVSNGNKNLCYSSISFFWQCAVIIDDYQKEKKEINSFELELYKEKVCNKENKTQFYGNLWKKLFRELIKINNDKRFDIKKSGINLFSQFFVAKIKSLNEINNITIDIIQNVFFLIFKDNINSFLSDENKKDDNNNSADNQKEQTDNIKNKEEDETSSMDFKEEIVLFTLQSMGKIIKSFIEENKNNDDIKKKQLEIIEKLCPIYMEFIDKKNTPQIAINILKNIGEFESADKIFFQENRQIFWEIIEKLIKYINNKELFIEQYSKSVKGIKVIQSIIESLLASFYSKEDIEILNSKSSIKNNINSLLEIIQKLFELTNIMEKTLINIDPYNIIATEKNLFKLIETIGEYCNNSNDVMKILNYLLKNINYNKEDKHSIAISCQSLETIGVILLNNKTLVNSIDEKYVKSIILECKDKIKQFFDLKNNNEILDNLTKHIIKKKDKYVWEKMIQSFNDYILKSAISKLKDEKSWEEIINYLVKIYNDIKEDDFLKENNSKEAEENENAINIENADNKEINNNINNKNDNDNKIEQRNNLIKSYKNIKKNIINFIINILLPNSGNISKNFQQKILKLLDIESVSTDKDNQEKKDNINNQNLFSIKQMNIENLFNVCNFKEESEIKKEFNNQLNNEKEEININGLKEYIDIKKNISKIYLPLLFKTCKDKIDEFIEYENKENKEQRTEEIIMILDGLKNLDSYCYELKDIPQNEILKSCINNKKGHLFILHHYFNKLIFTKNEEIKKKLFEIFEIIASQINLKQ